MTCLSCGSRNVYRSHSRGSTEKAVRLVCPVAYYRCHDCDWRGWGSTLKWNTIGNYAASILYLLFLATILLAIVGLMMFFVIFRPA